MKKNISERVVHPFGPVYDENSKILILGSLPSPKSRLIGFYYGNPQNRFWRVLAEVFKAPFPATVEEKRNFVISRNIALWDVIYSCRITGAADSSVREAVPNDFSLIFAAAHIMKVFTVGKTAHTLYKKFTGEDSYYLPSPSGANCAVPFEKLVEEYAAIENYLH